MTNSGNKFTKEENNQVNGASYVGNPKSNTVVFITKKVEHLLSRLATVDDCVVFAEEGMNVPNEVLCKHHFIFSNNPQLSYAEYTQKLMRDRLNREKKIKYISRNGFYISETASISPDAYIEPGCLIGHDVVIGQSAIILSGSIIKNSLIGDNFFCNEYAVIGANGFTMISDMMGNIIRMPSLGRVCIGNNVEVGAHDNISRGSAGDTIIEDYVKIDALVHVGHDAHIKKNVEITAGCVVGGFDLIGEETFIGINAALRNRIKIGANSTIGMGAVVTKNVSANKTVIGNPIKELEK